MKKIFLLLMGIIFMFSVANAKQQQRPVKHAHNGKSHTHVLPNNGRGKHNHRGNHNTKGAFYNKNVAHIHNGRRHSHVLPNGRKNHNHGGGSKDKATTRHNTQKTISHKNGIRTVNKQYDNGERYVGHMNDNGKKHGQGTYYWPDGQKYIGQWKDDEQEGQGTMYTPSGSKYTGEWKNGKQHGLITFTKKNGFTDTDLYKYGKPYGKIRKDLIKFVKANSFGSLVSKDGKEVKASWNRKDKKKNTIYFGGINSTGTIELDLPTGTAKITGLFSNGLLVSNGTLKVSSSKCYKYGWIFCKVSESGSNERSIKASSNLKKLIDRDLSAVRSKMYSRASRRISRLNNSSSTSGSLSYNCFGSGISGSMRNLCLAISKGDSSYCFGSGLSEGRKNLCLGASKQDSSYCFGSGLSEGDKNLCLAFSKNNSSYCFGSGLSEGMKNLCLGGSKQDSSYCFGSGLSESIKNLCLAISK